VDKRRQLIGLKLKKARKKKGLSQEEAAKFMHTCQGVISKIEKGKRGLDILEYMDLVRLYSSENITTLEDYSDA